MIDQLKQVLHLYLPFNIKWAGKEWLIGYFEPHESFAVLYGAKGGHVSLNWEQIKPPFRRLSSMTEEEKKEYNKRKQRKGYMAQIHADNTLWLIQRGFWLFGDEYFDKGIIIEAK